MTTPFRYPDYSQSLGVDSDIARREAAASEARREELLQGLLHDLNVRLDPSGRGLGLGGVGGMQRPAYGVNGVGTAGESPDQQGPMTLSDGTSLNPATTPVVGAKEADDLRAAAQYWKIPGAEAMDPQKLKAEVELRRHGVSRPESLGVMEGLGTMESLFRAGSQEEMARLFANLAGAVKTIPWGGPILGRITGADFVEAQIRAFQHANTAELERVAAALPEGNLKEFGQIRSLFNVLGGSVPAIGAWEAVGTAQGLPLVSTVAGKMLPAARLALHGMLTADLLERATPGITNQELQDIRVGGAAIPAAIHGVIEPFAGKLGQLLASRGAPSASRLHTDIPIFGDEARFNPGESEAQVIPESGQLGPGPMGDEGLGGMGAPREVPILPRNGPVAQPPVGGNVRGLIPGVGETYSPPWNPPSLSDEWQARANVAGRPSTPLSNQFNAWSAAANDPMMSPEMRDIASRRAEALRPQAEAERAGVSVAANLTLGARTGAWGMLENDPFASPELRAYAQERGASIGPERQLAAGQQFPEWLDPQGTARAAMDVSRFSEIPTMRPYNVIEPEASTAAMAKHVTVMESPEAARILSSPETIGDAEVAEAAHASNPVGTSVVRSVGDPATTSAKLTQRGVPHRVVEVRPSPRIVDFSTGLYEGREIPGVGRTQIHGPYSGSESGAPNLLIGVDESYQRQGFGTALYLDALNQTPISANPRELSPEAAATRQSLIDRGLARESAGPLGGPTLEITEQGRALHNELQRRGSQIDVLVGNVSDAQVAQYKQHGIFEGMDVTTANGASGSVKRIRPDGKVVVQKVGGGPPLTVKRENLTPGRMGNSVVDVPQVYEEFKQQLLDYANGEAEKGQEPPVAGLTDPRLTPYMQSAMTDFMDKTGIPQEVRPAVEEDLNNRWVEEFRKLSPEENKVSRQAERLAVDAAQERSNLEDIASFARTGEGTVGAGFDKSLFKKLGANMYTGDIGVVALKEGIQNAVDSMRGMGDGKLTIDFSAHERSLTIKDTGRGMSPQTMETAFMDVGGSFKDAPDASGGYGLAKVALFSRAEEIHAYSVFNDPRAGKLMTVISGSGEDWANGTMKFETVASANHVPTGTHLRLKFEKGVSTSPWQMTDFLKNVGKFSKLPFEIKAFGDLSSDAGDYSRIALQPESIADRTFAGGRMEVHQSTDQAPPSSWDPTRVSTKVHVLNRGLYQFSTEEYLPANSGAPSNIIVDITPQVDVESPDYPFTTSREDVKGPFKKEIAEVTKNLKLSAGRRELDVLVRALMQAPEVGNTGWTVLNDTNSVPAELVQRIASSQWVPKVIDHFEGMTENIAARMKERGHAPSEEPVVAGIGVSNRWLGVNVRVKNLDEMAKKLDPNTTTQYGGMRNKIFYNPFASYQEILVREHRNGRFPDSYEMGNLMAESMWDTAVHEYVHQHARLHDEDFAGVLTRAISATMKDAGTLIESAGMEMSRIVQTNEFADHYHEVSNAWADERKGTLDKILIHSQSGGAPSVQSSASGNELAGAFGGSSEGNGGGLSDAGSRYAEDLLGGRGVGTEGRSATAGLPVPDAPEPRVESLEDVAETKGYRWEVSPGNGGSLHDVTTPDAPPMQFASDDDARRFISTVDRGMGKDYTPTSAVPPEVARIPANSDIGKSGSKLAPKFDSHSDHLDAHHAGTAMLADDLDEMMRNMGAGPGEVPPPDLEDFVSYSRSGEQEPQPGTGWSYGNANLSRPGFEYSPPPPFNEHGVAPYQPPKFGAVPPGGGFPPYYTPPGGPFGGSYVPGGALREPTLAEQFQEMERRDPRKLHEMVRRQTGLYARAMRFMRYRFLDLQDDLVSNDITRGRVWDGFEQVDTGIKFAERDAHPWLESAHDILQDFPASVLPEKLARIHEITFGHARDLQWEDLANKEGWDSAKLAKVKEADGRLTDWFHNFFVHLSNDPAWALTAEREIFRYIPHVRSLQATQARAYDEGFLSPQMQFFAEHMRTGNITMRQMDIRDLVHYLVKSAMWKKHVAPAWGEFIQPWNDPQLPESVSPLRDFVQNWGKVARFGIDPEQSVAVRGIQSVARAMGLPLTGAEAGMIMGMPYRLAYTGMVGGRTAPMFRDTIQVLFTAAKAGLPDVLSVYQDLLTNPTATFRSIWDRGLQHGWIEQSRPDFELANLFERGASSSSELMAAPQEQLNRRAKLAEIGGRVRDMMPKWWSTQTALDAPVIPYLRQQQFQRGMAGEIGWRTATKAIQEFRQNGGIPVDGVNIAEAHSKWETLLDKSMASTFEPPIRQRFELMIRNGQDEQAAALMGRELANWSQFSGGSRQTAESLRGYGGKFVGFLGSYSFQLLSALQSMTQNGSAKQIAKAWLVFGSLAAGLSYAKEKTGWSFNKWSWQYGLLFGGSPALEPLASAYLAGTGAMTAAQGYNPSPVQRQAWNDMQRHPILAGFAATMNPYGGTMRSVDEITRDLQGINPGEQLPRFLITGERGSGLDVDRAMQQHWYGPVSPQQTMPPDRSPWGSMAAPPGTVQPSQPPATHFGGGGGAQ